MLGDVQRQAPVDQSRPAHRAERELLWPCSLYTSSKQSSSGSSWTRSLAKGGASLDWRLGSWGPSVMSLGHGSAMAASGVRPEPEMVAAPGAAACRRPPGRWRSGGGVGVSGVLAPGLSASCFGVLEAGTPGLQRISSIRSGTVGPPASPERIAQRHPMPQSSPDGSRRRVRPWISSGGHQNAPGSLRPIEVVTSLAPDKRSALCPAGTTSSMAKSLASPGSAPASSLVACGAFAVVSASSTSNPQARSRTLF